MDRSLFMCEMMMNDDACVGKKPKGAPKNPLSAYTLFVVETRRQVSEAHPHLSFGEIAVLGKCWFVFVDC